jgi:hypothetical protein
MNNAKQYSMCEVLSLVLLECLNRSHEIVKKSIWCQKTTAKQTSVEPKLAGKQLSKQPVLPLCATEERFCVIRVTQRKWTMFSVQCVPKIPKAQFY